MVHRVDSGHDVYAVAQATATNIERTTTNVTSENELPGQVEPASGTAQGGGEENDANGSLATQDSADDFGGFDEYEHADTFDAFDEPRPLAVFDVRGDELVGGTDDAEVVGRATAVWGRFVELIPPEQRRMLAGFELMDRKYDGAHVYPTDDDPTRWVLGVAEGLGGDLDMTLIHEWGHLVTLKASEVPPNVYASGCRTYFTGEGCANPDSTFARFVDVFWPQALVDEANLVYALDDEDEYFEALDDFLVDHQGEFVTEYAASNPGEDLAETIAVFVLTDRPVDTTVSDQKVLFLWNDPNFVTLREQIRACL